MVFFFFDPFTIIIFFIQEDIVFEFILFQHLSVFTSRQKWFAVRSQSANGVIAYGFTDRLFHISLSIKIQSTAVCGQVYSYNAIASTLPYFPSYVFDFEVDCIVWTNFIIVSSALKFFPHKSRFYRAFSCTVCLFCKF